MTCYSVEICPGKHEPFVIADYSGLDVGFRRLDQLVQEAVAAWAAPSGDGRLASPEVRVTVNGIEIYRWALSQDPGEAPRLRPLAS